MRLVSVFVAGALLLRRLSLPLFLLASSGTAGFLSSIAVLVVPAVTVTVPQPLARDTPESAAGAWGSGLDLDFDPAWDWNVDGIAILSHSESEVSDGEEVGSIIQTS